jgi:hypothetical protein
MGTDGQQGIDLGNAPRGCIVAGCACTDGRLLSPRRARFHAYLARQRGETADRVIPLDPEWRLPASLPEES